MIVEAIGEGFTYTWPGGEVRLEPGKPVGLPNERAKRLLAKAPGRVRVVPPSIQPGDSILWTRSDGSVHHAKVDFVHGDSDGARWAFVTIGIGWAAVNLTYAQRVSEL